MLIVLYLVFVVGIGVIAQSRGRSGVGWALIALFLSPFIAAIALALTPARVGSQALDLQAEIRNRAIASELEPYIHSYKPAFSARLVHKVQHLDGTKRRFKDRLDALAYVASNRDQLRPLRPVSPNQLARLEPRF